MSNNTHGFNVELASKYGLEEAILINHFIFWQKHYESNHNKAVESGHFHDNDYWIYNSTAAWHNQYPYLSIAVIKRALSNLESLGIIRTGNYNKIAYDRTKWYAFIPSAINDNPSNNLPNPLVNLTNETANMANQTEQNHQPIPVTNTVTNTVTNQIKEKHSQKNKIQKLEPNQKNFDFLCFDDNEVIAIKSWLTYKKEKKQEYKSSSFNALRNKLLKFKQQNQSICDIINNSIANNWSGLFEIQQATSKTKNQSIRDTLHRANDNFVVTKF